MLTTSLLLLVPEALDVPLFEDEELAVVEDAAVSVLDVLSVLVEEDTALTVELSDVVVAGGGVGGGGGAMAAAVSDESSAEAEVVPPVVVAASVEAEKELAGGGGGGMAPSVPPISS